MHEPDIFPRVPPRVALTLAGHTHGGQIVLPFICRRCDPSKYGARFAYGHIVEQGRHMIVSGGLGSSMVPVRLGVPPEIVLIELGGESQKHGARQSAVAQLESRPAGMMATILPTLDAQPRD